MEQTETKTKKTPRLDSGFAATEALRREVQPMLDELKASPEPGLIDERTGELTARGWNKEMQLNERRKAEMKALDPHAAAEKRRREEHEQDKQRALLLDARVLQIRMAIEAIPAAWRSFGAPTDPQALGLINRCLSDVEADLLAAMQRSGLDGAEKLIVRHETRVVPELRERCVELQNQYLALIAKARLAEASERAREAAKKLSAAQVLQRLQSAGIALRLDGDALEFSGVRGLDDAEKLMVEMHKPGIIAELRARSEWRRL